MYLKAIEMQGFKSFADKTKVTFGQGVTAVVGPNGSGKSNITESLRWALGESSAKSLRGGKMPDIIFAGTESRKALNFAQVSVVLDNSDGFIGDRAKEIRVERHIYRNGDSDYLIDGKKVRLRDIHDLFMDTGLGRDSFSIISQGRVESIFNSKPEERRTIFEEAAGVLKYKTRKKETESKLNQTQDNLDRLEDIIYELDNQVKPLEKQARTAKEFLVLEEERSQLHLSILIEDIALYQAELANKEAELATAQADLKAYYIKRDQLEAENQSLKTKRHRLSEEVAEQQANLVDLARLIGEYQRQIDVIRLEKNQSAEKQADRESRLAALQSQINETQIKKDELEQGMQERQADLAQVQADLQTLQGERAKYEGNPDELIERLRDDFVQLMQEEADLSNALTTVEAELDSQKQADASKLAELAQLETDLADTKSQLAAAQESWEVAQAHVAELLKTYQTLAQAVKEQEEAYQSQQQALFATLDQIKNKEARQNSLEAIQKNHSQFYAGVKAVLQESSKLGGIIGAVSEHLTFDTDYQTALEIALGGSAQHIIVEDEAAAKRSIDFLKRTRQGRATFLPLTTIRPRELNGGHYQTLSQAPGFKGMASQLVTFDERLSSIFQNLLGLTAIFATVEEANQAARAVRYQVRIVTLDGTEIRPGGSFSGGASRHNNTTFIKPELDALIGEIAELRATLTAQEKEVETSRSTLKAKQAELEDLQKTGEAARLQEQKEHLSLQQIQQRLDDLTQIYQGLTGTGQVEIGEDLQARQGQLKAKLTEIADQKQDLNAQIQKIREDKDAIAERLNSLNQALTDAGLKERELQGELRFAQADYKRLSSELDQLQRDQEALQTLMTSTHEALDQDKLPELEGQLKTAKEQQNQAQTALVRLKFELEDCEAGLEDIAEQLTKASQQNEGLIRQQTQLEAQIQTVSDKLLGFARQLAEDYQLSFDEAKAQAQHIESLDQARQTLKDLQRQIKALGPVNIDAIAQYDEVADRLTFLSGQREDLVHAKNLLMETITEMDDEVKARFKASFEAIRESFKQTFKQMFGGGSADLILTESDLLSAGVEISVQPPGKKIQSLNLMSGGEKALSALALLFAIIRVKTIPFVILDEVEAALDEANVKRFGDYLNRFDKSSQFIVVTHRKGTMAAADSIYGVTMQESGVSKVVSVKLKEAGQLLD
ncbi:chromosome segregation protein SMC [Streptococcus caprae]|uniref:Chromosome partition protein Smc n=1 Tax=Streptococcus caprae TaxID=1640501 RepID=A0ABV8CYE3_9STRE